MKFKFWPLLIAVLATTVLLRLGFWQLERAEEKQQALSKLAQQQDLSIENWVAVEDFDSIHSHRVKFKGTIVGQQVWLLDNRVFEGQVGYSVITQFKIKGIERYALVDWGWVKAPVSRAELPTIELPDAELLLQGLVKTMDFRQVVLKQTSEVGWPRRIQSLRELDLSQGIIYADSGLVEGLVQIYKPVVMPPEKHQAYAMQWFLLALACAAIFVFASRKRGIIDEG